MKQYIGISRDHSGSMQTLVDAAKNDYNINIDSIKTESKNHSIDTIVSVIKCGIGPGAGRIERESVNSNVNVLKPLSTYPVNGGSTPLFDSVVELIDLLKSVPDADDLEVSFLVMMITDGGDNASRIKGPALGEMIRKLQNTDRWTFVFRVPRGHARELVRLGIPEGNIQEWDQTRRGMEVSTEQSVQAFKNFYTKRASGVKATRGFYSDLSHVTSSDVQTVLDDITSRVSLYRANIDGEQISAFCTRTHGEYSKGYGYYELTKHEKAIQDHKKICIQNTDGKIYTGDAARQMLGLPTYGSVSISPGNHNGFKIFVQSTSSNRKLVAGTSVLYYNGQ